MSRVVSNPQADFIEDSTTPTLLFCAGLGAGKTLASEYKVVNFVLQNQGIDVLYALPSYRLVKDTIQQRLPATLRAMGIKYKMMVADQTIIVGQSRILLRSYDSPETQLVSFEVGLSVIDELDVLPLEQARRVYQLCAARTRQGQDRLPNQIAIVSTPNQGKAGLMYELSLKDNVRTIQAPTASNPAATQQYIDQLKNTFTPAQLGCYLFGEFTDQVRGLLVYSQYDPELNDSRELVKQGDRLHIGVDFNAGLCCGIVGVKRNGQLHIVDEFHHERDVQSLCQAIIDRYPRHHENGLITAYPDASGQNRHASGSQTMHNIMRSDYGLSLSVDTTNPRILDRVNTVNVAFENASQERNLFVNRETCPELTKCLRSQIYDSKTLLPDKLGGFDHVLDGLGYLVYRVKPITQPIFELGIRF
ncbi:hypothetical protein [Paraferrimonas sedimenticola]|uniref:Terminase n=1 Tax=Paraferrimonas sedimenticola TaxID=375674 RepID=A0AA37VXN6_9GAMM|nr:hypothetical protein [Paraferrimonas sedimenticola]GLP95350.1 terminase [Paraferrimonas sedimenticola]